MDTASHHEILTPPSTTESWHELRSVGLAWKVQLIDDTNYDWFVPLGYHKHTQAAKQDKPVWQKHYKLSTHVVAQYQDVREEKVIIRILFEFEDHELSKYS